MEKALQQLSNGNRDFKKGESRKEKVMSESQDL
jgi:hypothetical protein